MRVDIQPAGVFSFLILCSRSFQFYLLLPLSNYIGSGAHRDQQAFIIVERHPGDRDFPPGTHDITSSRKGVAAPRPEVVHTQVDGAYF